jgi:hypothetical protein
MKDDLGTSEFLMCQFALGVQSGGHVQEFRRDENRVAPRSPLLRQVVVFLDEKVDELTSADHILATWIHF